MSYWSREIGDRWRSRLAMMLQLALCLAPVAIMLLIAENLHRYESRLRDKLRYVIYLNDKTTGEDLQSLITRAKSLEGFASFTYRDKSEVFREMQDVVGAELLPGQTANPFPHLLELRFQNRASTLANFERATIELKKFPTVEEINYGADWLAAQERAFAASQQIAAVLRLITMAAAALLVYWQTRRLRFSHQPFLKSLSLLGANWRHLALPVLNRMVGDAMLAALTCLGALYLACVLAEHWQLELSFFSLTGAFFVLFLTVATAVIGAAVALRGARG